MIREYLPYNIYKSLFGDRKRYGGKAWPNDSDWEKWQQLYPEAYQKTQKSNFLQLAINNAGYKILRSVNVQGKKLAEIGPGGAYHFSFFQGTPEIYHAIDVCEDFFKPVQQNAQQNNFPTNCHLITPYSAAIPLESNSMDFFLSFYSLEHLYVLEDWMSEIFRILKPGGSLIGAIPTEGGILWGLGRYFTSRRFLKNQYKLDMEKIVCWEHPNMCDDIVNILKRKGNNSIFYKFPFPFLSYDFNFVLTFKVIK